jgi:hypothetical protein
MTESKKPSQAERNAQSLAEWQSMATARKDGSRILLWDAAFRRCVVARWDFERWHIGDYGAEHEPRKASHWMPLPEPPRNADEEIERPNAV